ncbi:TonB-dependent receptor [Sphingobium sp.]|uniref:TonB-dependent receptor n=1 Tax=Sphingobium sp. TaxID=1912891 RepID=UPI0028BDCBBB|nr:TonB-dependent receptor [Sphingobium sp.]
MKGYVKPYLAGCCAIWVLGSAAPALAQSENPDQNADSSRQVEEIIVTAQRREQKLQDVPIAVSAVTSAGLQGAGATGMANLQVAVPSLNITRNANGALPFLRGVGSSLGDINAESSVAVYIDGVYQPTYLANYMEFNDVERIEVLKGPQGTLFGRNATGGVIQVITKDPTEKLEGSAYAGYGNYDTATLNGYVSVPIAEGVGLSTSAYWSHRDDGYGRNLFLGKENPGAKDFSARSKLVLKPGDATKITLAGYYSRSINGGLEAQQPDIPNTTTAIPFPGKFNTNNNWPNTSDVKSYGGSLHVDHDFGAAQFVSITGYQRVKGIWQLDFDETPINVIGTHGSETSKMWSQEVHLLSPSDSKIQWLVGGYYYFRESGWDPNSIYGIVFDPNFTDPNAGIDQYGITKVRSKSLFAQATVSIGPDTSITGGFRYAWEDIKATAYTTPVGVPVIIDTPDGLPAHNTFSYSRPTWRITLDHKFTPDIMAYASYNRGMKSGNFGLAAGAMGIATPYQPEKIDAFEVGLKTELFDRRVRFNVSGFYYDFKNLQIQKYVGGASFVINAPSAQFYGGEVELEAHPTDHLTLNANLGLLHTEYGDFPASAGNNVIVNTCLTPSGSNDNGGFICDPVTHFATTTPFNGKGLPVVLAPDVTGNIGFTYRQPSSVGEFTFSGNAYYVASTSAEVGNRVRQPSHTLLNGSIAWADSSDRFSVRVWGKNLANEYYYTQISPAPGLNDVAGPGEPRTYGLTVGVKF